MFWKKKQYVPDDERLKSVIDILFPPLKTENFPDGSKVQIDYSVDSNLQAALVDLQDGVNDSTVHATISSCINKIAQVRQVLEAEAIIDLEAKFLVVDHEDVIDIDRIKPVEH